MRSGVITKMKGNIFLSIVMMVILKVADYEEFVEVCRGLVDRM